LSHFFAEQKIQQKKRKSNYCLSWIIRRI